jgi:hypothetical protein
MRQRELDSILIELDAWDRCGNHLAVRRRRTEAPSKEAVEGGTVEEDFFFVAMWYGIGERTVGPAGMRG